jgi:AcrR family transcriptional regulator
MAGRAASSAAGRGRPRGGLADKHQAILEGALVIFARDGYSRASIDAIAAQAQVSTRTIYNHFRDKADLFQAVIQMSATRVADAQIMIIDNFFRKVTDLEEDLVDFAEAWLTPMPDYADHSALVRQINAEVGHIPAAAIETWQQTGPRRVLTALAEKLAVLAERGWLTLDDPELAAHQFAVLITVPNPSLRGDTGEPGDTRSVRSGVRVFLNGYGP